MWSGEVPKDEAGVSLHFIGKMEKVQMYVKSLTESPPKGLVS